MSNLANNESRRPSGQADRCGPNQDIPGCEYGQCVKEESHFARKLSTIFLKFSGLVCALYVLCIWSLEPEIKPREGRNLRSADRFSFSRMFDTPSRDEQRIARHFEMDTLPGLMQRGLIRKYERRDSGTLLLVEGKIWRQRSRFFRESLLTEMLVYNKVNGFASTTHVADYSSHRLYARASSADRKEFFD
jgi:hypothetical protein